MAETEFRIPKISVPVVLNTTEKEKIVAEIFLDYQSSDNFTLEELSNFFNTDNPFLPIRSSAKNKTILLRRDSIVWIDLSQIKQQLLESTSMSLAYKREVVLHSQSAGALHATVIMEMPADHSRVIDLLNLKRIFIPVLVEEKFALVNLHHIDQIEEL